MVPWFLLIVQMMTEIRFNILFDKEAEIIDTNQLSYDEIKYDFVPRILVIIIGRFAPILAKVCIETAS